MFYLKYQIIIQTRIKSNIENGQIELQIYDLIGNVQKWIVVYNELSQILAEELVLHLVSHFGKYTIIN